MKVSKETNIILIISKIVPVLIVLSVGHLWIAPIEGADRYLIMFAGTYLALAVLSIFLLLKSSGIIRVFLVIGIILAIGLLCYDLFAAAVMTSVKF